MIASPRVWYRHHRTATLFVLTAAVGHIGASVTVWDLANAMRRQWWLVLLGVLGVALGVVYVLRTPGVYWARTEVDFALPVSAANPNPLQFTSGDLISLAGIVAKRVELPGRLQSATTSPISILGEGVDHGYSVVLPSTGGQWSPNFERATLVVQAIGSSDEEVSAQMGRVISEIGSELEELQDEAQVSPQFRASLRTSVSPVVYYGKGSPLRALSAWLVLSLGATLALVIIVDAVRNGGLYSDAPQQSVDLTGAAPQ
jgi:hypothetical protein